jgi:hypothetical protein
MPAFRIQAFAGMIPRLDARLLGPAQAQTAVNCLLLDGDIVPLKNPLVVTRPNKAGPLKSIYRMVDAAGAAYWLSWNRDVNVKKGPIAGDTLQRTYYTGDGEPRMTTLADAISGGGNDYPKNFFVLGVTKPTTAPTVGHTAGAAANETRAYVYTNVTQYGEESAPSPAGEHTAPSDATSWDLSAMETAPLNAFTVTGASWSGGVATLTVASTRGLRVKEEISVAGMNPSGYNTSLAAITAMTATTVSYAVAVNPGAFVSGGTLSRIAPHNTTGMVKRIYRTVTSVNAVDYFFVAEIPVAQTTYTDTLSNSIVSGQGTLKTLGWDMPPADMHSLTAMANGMMAGLSGNTVCLCEPYYPYAWPTAYQQSMIFDGVSLSGSDTSLMATTKGNPYIFTGNHPSSISQRMIEETWPCVAKRGTAGISGGMLYPTHQGLAVIGPGVTQIVTKDLYKPENDIGGWPKLTPSSLIATYHNSRYYGAYTDADTEGQKILILDKGEAAQVVQANVSITALYSDPISGYLYVVVDGEIQQWDGDAGSKLLFEWFSKEFLFQPPVNMAAAKVDADFTLSDSDSTALQAARNAVILANQAIIGSANIVRTGNTTSGSAVVTNLSKTSDLLRWMTCTGTGIPASTKIKSVDSSSQVTLTANATATGTPSLTFTGSKKIVDGALCAAPLNKYAINASAIQALPAITYDIIQFTLYADGEVKFSKQVINNKAFRLPGGYKKDNIAVKLSGNVRVRGIVVGSSMSALREA